MAEMASFATELLEEAKHFLAKAIDSKDSEAKMAFLHASLLIGFASFEAHVNEIADDFLTRTDLTSHERGILAEHSVDLVDGEFREGTRLKIHRLEDRVLFLCLRFSKKPINRQATYWGDFTEATKLRNSLTHPKNLPPSIQVAAVRRALTAIIELLNTMYSSIYKKKLPAHSRGLSSKLLF